MRAVLLLVAYLLLFPPLFVLGPLAGLLAASRPATLREWMWIGAAGLWLTLSLSLPGGIAPQMTQAWPLFVTTAFVALMLVGRRALVPGALLATIFGLGGATGWIWSLGTRWQDIQLAMARMGWEQCRQLLIQIRALAPEKAAGLQVAVEAMADGVGWMVELYPALLVLSALPGLAIAWSWYHRLAAHPTGAPAGRFAEFRFSDQFVWGVVLALVGIVAPVPDQLQPVLGNIALVAGGLYAARGAAIVWGGIEEFPLLVLIVIGVGIIFILPVALGGLFSLGLADTWVDFRRRFAADSKRSDRWK
ncbi:MAG: hypothetical protein ABI587_13520 [Gemmatimonadales bacterium]